MNFSAQSFEIKKFCIVTIATVSTIILGINPERWILCCFILATTFLFYFIDAFIYYYQRNLREKMITEENKIYNRHNISETRNQLAKTSWTHAFFNRSHFMYFVIIILASLFLLCFLCERYK